MLLTSHSWSSDDSWLCDGIQLIVIGSCLTTRRETKSRARHRHVHWFNYALIFDLPITPHIFIWRSRKRTVDCEFYFRIYSMLRESYVFDVEFFLGVPVLRSPKSCFWNDVPRMCSALKPKRVNLFESNCICEKSQSLFRT